MNRKLVLLLLLALVLSTLLVVIYFKRINQSKKVSVDTYIAKEEVTTIESSKISPILPSPTPRNIPKPTFPPRPIPRGKTGFTVGVKDNPLMRIGFIDPYDPLVGEKQTVSITVKNQNPVDSVTATMQTDNHSKQYPMKLAEGTTTDGRWEGTWEVEDTHLYTYVLTIDAVSGVDTSKGILILRK